MTDAVRAAPRPATSSWRDLPPTRGSRAAAWVLAGLTVVHLAAQLLPLGLVLQPAGNLVVIETAWVAGVARVTQGLLMPALAAVVLLATRAPRSRLVRLTVLALAFSFLGDVLPGLVPARWSFVALVLSFAAAQVVYVVAFRPFVRDSVAVRRRGLLVPYGLAYLVAVTTIAVLVLGPGGAGPAGLMTVVLSAGYGLLLVTMAVLATGVHRLAGVGAVVFLVSDALIGLTTAGFAWGSILPLGGPGFLVMATYVTGQALIAAGVLARRG